MLSGIERDESRNGQALTKAMKQIDALNEENRALEAFFPLCGRVDRRRREKTLTSSIT